MQARRKVRAARGFAKSTNLAARRIQFIMYQYDCFDRRISKQVDTTPSGALEAARQWFAYDGANVRLEFVDPDGSGAAPAILTTRYFNGLGVDNIIAQENYAGGDFTAGAYWHLKNHLGSTTDLVAHVDQGGHQNRIIYDSYGNVVSQSNAAISSRYLYTGREFDSETGLQYYRARYYDSTLGRFVGEDPIAGSNLYGYVGGNPINFTDPFGLRKLIPLPGKPQQAQYDYSGSKHFDLGVSKNADLSAGGRRHDWTRDRIIQELAATNRRFGRKESDQLDRGCVGLTSLFLGKQGDGEYATTPEKTPGTQAFLSEDSAHARSVPKGFTNVVYGKQGAFMTPDGHGGMIIGGPAPVPAANGQVPIASIYNNNGMFNYVLSFPDTGTYAWANSGASVEQHFIIDKAYPNMPTIWYSTPVRGW